MSNSPTLRQCMASVFAVIVIPGMVLAASHVDQSLRSLGWKEKSFSGNTLYTVEGSGNTMAIKGQTNGAASALYQDSKIDLDATPLLSWKWKVSNVFDNTREKQKSGDDFPARLYVVYQRGMFKWNTIAINYVWSSQHPVGESWDSAYTSKAKIVVMQTGEANAGTWVEEKRNVVEDFKTLFNTDVSNLNGYALMVDGDNTGGAATGWFADIAFKAQ